MIEVKLTMYNFNFRENLLRMKLYYEELSYTNVEQFPAYTLANLGSKYRRVARLSVQVKHFLEVDLFGRL